MPKVLYQPFEMQVSNLQHWNKEPLIYHFFEIVQIAEGCGRREANRNKLRYSTGDIFLFTPLDCRGFVSEVPTRFYSIRFSEIFLGQDRSPHDQARISLWLRKLQSIFFHHNRFHQLPITDPEDCRTVNSLIQSLAGEYVRKPLRHEENLQHFIMLILNILERNVLAQGAPVIHAHADESVVHQMLMHIQRHIGEPEKLSVDSLAATFNLSATYVGEYFRKYTGESLQHYIVGAKIKRAEQRLLHSNLSLTQIADELGFVDDSHLSKQFKKRYGTSPVKYRKAAGQLPEQDAIGDT
ncbi:AraC family transcriptional regulator [Fulvivirgaceae bacterium PWU5]|uniref:AraC family transcriptional regulator n=1 Tax=Dawidia cretensis TaxID=2782350 RepID=A0AAP2E1V7_9BACT|nr:AraC family transcriptional regulator [Dawidia cretensis]MBT1711205.1 AraC family transcriptional regulator [Dawidia cretensis]